MKVVTVLPVKNEAWILPYSLKNFSDFSDSIIVADQHSTDGSREIYKEFPKVHVIDNDRLGHSNQVRWSLLEAARAAYADPLIVCLDADEFITPEAIHALRTSEIQAPAGFSTRWIQLIGDGKKHRTDGIWKHPIKSFAFFDDRIVSYHDRIVVNDHTNRIPEIEHIVPISQPILHLQFMAPRRNRIKMAWYMCQELMHDVHPIRVNARHAVNDQYHYRSESVDREWVRGIDLPPQDVLLRTDELRLKEIHAFFDERGILFFESLTLWDIPELRDRFVHEIGREPHAIDLPHWLLSLNALRNNAAATLKNLWPKK